MKRRHFIGGCTFLPSLAGLAETPKLTPWRLDARVYSAKSDRVSKAEQYDDRAVRMNFRIEVTNQEFKQKLENATATLIAFAKHVTENDELKVMLRDETKFTLEPVKKHVHETPSVKFEYDDKDSAQFGHKYFGYLMVIKNSSGEYLAIRSTPPLLANDVETALKLKVNAIVGRDFKPRTGR